MFAHGPGTGFTLTAVPAPEPRRPVYEKVQSELFPVFDWAIAGAAKARLATTAEAIEKRRVIIIIVSGGFWPMLRMQGVDGDLLVREPFRAGHHRRCATPRPSLSC